MLLLSMGVSAQGLSVAESELSVAERNAQLGFDDTIDRLAEDFVEVSLVVCNPGELLYSSFGHVMLRLRCRTFGLDNVFTYESEPIYDNWARFLQGDLKMGMYAIPVDSMLRPYRDDGRGVVEYMLHLSPTQEQNLWRIMDEMVEKGANQPYDYYNHGCALSVVHVLSQAVGRQRIKYAPWPKKFDSTMRELGYECVTRSGQFWNRFVLMTLAGSDIDGTLPQERKLIVPTDLAETWQRATLDGHPLLESTPRVLVEHTLKSKQTRITPLMVSVLLLVLSLFSFFVRNTRISGLGIVAQSIDYLVLACQTIIGIFVSYTVIFSTLPCTTWNWLIIPFNILPAICWYWRRYWALPYVGICLVWIVVMLLWPHRLVEPAHILLALSFSIILLKQWWVAKEKI